LLDVFVAFLGGGGRARLLVFASDLDSEARGVLMRERDELDLVDEVALVGEAPGERYAAYRAATVALSIGAQASLGATVMPLWFDIPLVAFAETVLPDAVEAAGIVSSGGDVRHAAALVRLVARDERLRAAMRAEGRRVRERHAPRNVATLVLDALHAPAGVAQSISST
jgi:glycosyltransferase involved in cell wall biosynthesis